MTDDLFVNLICCAKPCPIVFGLLDFPLEKKVHHLTRDSQRDPESLLLIVAMLTDPDAVEVEKKSLPKHVSLV